jgi:OmcA/MtrC family decaheme c-type cytochrome
MLKPGYLQVTKKWMDKMKQSVTRWSWALLVAMAVAGCGGGGGGGGTTPPTGTTVNSAITAAAALPGNDSSTNSAAPFAVLQAAGVPAVTINSPPVVNFTVFSGGKVVTGLTTSNVRFAIAKLVPGANGNPDQWVSYISKTVNGVAGFGPGGTPVLASASQATTDTATATQLVYNPDGYYTYTFTKDIKTVKDSAGKLLWDPTMTQRVAIQLSYTNAAGATVLVNPYFDFTVGSDGKSIPVADSSKTRVMTNVASCNSCHDKLALHGGGRVDTQYCVMCHNPGTVDPESGNNLNLVTMVHKIHAGKKIAADGGGHYTIWGYGNSKNDYAEVGFPQDLRNCTKCHSASNPATPQGDNWKTVVTQSACLTCHVSQAGSLWETGHKVYAGTLVGAGAAATDLTNAQCAACHKPGSNIASETVHWNQNEENAAKYKMNIESVTYDSTTRNVTVKYFLSDPTNGNKAYDLTTGCASASSCATTTLFGNLRLYVAYQNMVGQSTAVTEFSAYNNGGSSTNAYAY